MLKKRMKFGGWGLTYGVISWLWGALGSGGGHYDLPIELTSPIGFVLWPAVWALAYDLKPLRPRIAFITLMALHYSILVAYLLNEDAGTSDAYWYGIATRNNSHYVIFPVISLSAFGISQSYLWSRFAKAVSGPQKC